MKILHKYILKTLLRNLFFAVVTMTLLFLVFDFFERIDNILEKEPEFLTVILYFLYKVPQFIVLTLPISFIAATLFTYGMLSKNSEITAMRAAGLKLIFLAKPLLITGFVVSLINLFLNETIIPTSVRHSKEIYNIDIKQKDKTGIYSQEDIWWRDTKRFYTAGMFDSRDSTLHNFSYFELNKGFDVIERTDSNKVKWVAPDLGWSMNRVVEYKFKDNKHADKNSLKSLPLPIEKSPEDFFNTEQEPLAMTYAQLDRFIKEQEANGLPADGYFADLYAKISFPFVVFIVGFAVLPFAIKPARTGSLASSFIAGILICFVYYAMHSFSLALGRAEFLPALFSAWIANIILGLIAIILFTGVEAPE